MGAAAKYRLTRARDVGASEREAQDQLLSDLEPAELRLLDCEAGRCALSCEAARDCARRFESGVIASREDADEVAQDWADTSVEHWARMTPATGDVPPL